MRALNSSMLMKAPWGSSSGGVGIVVQVVGVVVAAVVVRWAVGAGDAAGLPVVCRGFAPSRRRNSPPARPSANSADTSTPFESASRDLKAYSACAGVSGGTKFLVPWMNCVSLMGFSSTPAYRSVSLASSAAKASGADGKAPSMLDLNSAIVMGMLCSDFAWPAPKVVVVVTRKKPPDLRPSTNSSDSKRPSLLTSRPLKAYLACSSVRGGLKFLVPRTNSTMSNGFSSKAASRSVRLASSAANASLAVA
mmetsp:Transcript_64332/g.199207  ORF Transcript_64332/g.199207 Transcript_64332/m.199207 type:complete len:250 (-) Transcript_64332:205-954(-)